MRRQVRDFAVDRDEPLWVGCSHERRQLVLLRVTAGVHFENAVMHDVRTELSETIAQAGDRRFVTRDRMRAQDNRVVLGDRHVTVLTDDELPQHGA